MDVESFLLASSAEQIVDTIVELSLAQNESSFDDLRDLLLVRDNHTFGKHAIPQLVSRALLRKGCRGVEVLVGALSNAPGSIYPTTIIETLWHAARGQHLPPFPLGRMQPKPPLDEPLSEETIIAAREAFHDLVVESQESEGLFDHLMSFLYRVNTYSNDQEKGKTYRAEVFDIFSEATIKLTRRLISDLVELVNGKNSEESYQQFLKTNPVLIDPLASQLLPKQKLGIEFVTDFVLRRIDNEYCLVEIEKPQDKLFTAAGDFTAKLTHAVGQIVDFQEWVDQHGEYARCLMPGISSPKGLLIMGRRGCLSERDASKLKRYLINLNSIRILTYDDLVTQAQNFYRNIHREAGR